MSENENIAKMAEKLSREIFSVFGWEAKGPRNHNWSCVNIERHKKKKAKTHPSDVVFKYQDPHIGRDIYLTTDLKSYGSESIKSFKIEKKLKDIAQAVECANGSPVFQELYVDTNAQWRAAGLLFLYNHDGYYD